MQEYKGRRGRPAGKHKPDNPDLHLVVVQSSIPLKYLRALDHYCDDTRTSRSEIIKTAVLKYMKELGIYEHTPFFNDPSLVKPVRQDPKQREIDPGTWTTDPGDFGEPDYDRDVPPSDYIEGT